MQFSGAIGYKMLILVVMEGGNIVSGGMNNSSSVGFFGWRYDCIG